MAQPMSKDVRSQQSSLIENLRTLHRAVWQDFSDEESLFKIYLDAGRSMFRMSTGTIGRIVKGTYNIKAISGSELAIAKDRSFGINEADCSRIVTLKSPVVHRCVSRDPEMRDHPFHRATGLESFIGAPIYVNGEIFGTINFSDREPKPDDFGEYEIELIQLMAEAIGKLLESFFTKKRLSHFFEQSVFGFALCSMDGRIIDATESSRRRKKSRSTASTPRAPTALIARSTSKKTSRSRRNFCTLRGSQVSAFLPPVSAMKLTTRSRSSTGT